MKLKYFIYLLLFSQLCVFSQELPPIEVFKPKDYAAEDQNWAVSQGNDKSIYFANNKGLLSYNGSRWKLYKSSNSSIFRSCVLSVKKENVKLITYFGYHR